MTETAQAPNCLDIITPFNDGLLASPTMPEVQLMGGIASAALQHPGTEIRVDERCIATAKDFLEDEDTIKALEPLRENGTLRDMDALVLSTDPLEVARVEALAGETIGSQLEISVFGLHKAAKLQEQAANPFGLQALKTFVSDRYVREDGTVQKALFPFAVELPKEALETYWLEIGDNVFPVANPVASVLNYWTRSISGLRPKDDEKVHKVAGHIFDKAPELAEWAVDGPGQSQMELAAIFQTLRRANSWPKSKRHLNVGNTLQMTAGSVRSLAGHEAFMLRGTSQNKQDAVLMVALLKSRGLGIGESNPAIVKLFQTFAEKRLDTITKNQ